jgi:plastocyanin
MKKNKSLSLIGMTAWVYLIIIDIAIAGTITGVATLQGKRNHENIVIYIEKVGENPFNPPTEQAIIDQINLTFVPHVMPILVGSTINFPNSDKVRHNIFSPSKTKKFNLGTYPVGTTKSVTFEKPGLGLVVLLCNVHTEMSAFVLVLKNPYFAVTDETGAFSIPNQKAMKAAHVDKYSDLPAGTYRIRVWHESSRPQIQEVVVPAQGKVQANFELKRGERGKKLYDEEEKE